MVERDETFNDKIESTEAKQTADFEGIKKSYVYHSDEPTDKPGNLACRFWLTTSDIETCGNCDNARMMSSVAISGALAKASPEHPMSVSGTCDEDQRLRRGCGVGAFIVNPLIITD